ncbi:MAG: MFS transporter [Acetobacteraceae bacterium]
MGWPASWRAAWRGLSGPARGLILARLLRSVAQGALVVDFSLYARALGWSAPFLGLVLGAAMLFGAALTGLVGPLSDRLGRRRFLLAYDGAVFAAALVALTVSARLPLACAAVVAGFGRGFNGAAGPFAPVEQAWLAGLVPQGRLGRVLSFNMAVGFSGMTIGALLAAVPGLVGGGAAAYRPLFALTALAAGAVFLLVRGLPEPARAADSQGGVKLARGERALVLRLALVNSLNGLGIGMVAPLLPLWFALRFGLGPGEIAPVVAVGLLLAAAASLLGGRLAGAIGTVRAVVVMRAAGLVFLVALPFAPDFAAAAVLYAARSASNRGTAGARQALALGLVGGGRRGLVASVNTLSMQVPRALGPAVAGLLFARGDLALPFLIAGLCQGLYLVLYRWMFAGYDREARERAVRPEGGG